MGGEVLQILRPGTALENDWCSFPVPSNIEVGENTMIDSSSCFKKFFSALPLGLKIGNSVTLSGPSLATEKDAYIEIGDNCYISGASLVASREIIIGKYVYIADGVTIVDTDFHPLDPGARLLDTIAISPIGDKSRRPWFPAAPVRIGDDVWIGFNATILKGVTIGNRSVIQPGAVVSKDIPAGCTVEGNPAHITGHEFD